MKKRILCLALAALVAAACAVSAFGSGGRTLVTLSYLNGTYASQLRARFTSALSALEASCQTAITRLNGQSAASSAWSGSGQFRPAYPRRGETAVLSEGSGLFWQAGTGTADKVLVDVTDGAELAAGRALAEGHRYLALESTVVTASSDAACALEGYWRTNATGTEPPRALFTDVPVGSWFYEPVRFVVEHNLFNGTGDGKFSPMGGMDRAMLVTVLYRMAGQPAVSGRNPFTDVKDSAWYASAVLWAAQAGLLAGIADDTAFQPTTPITREQIAVMFYRFAARAGCNVSTRGDLGGYADSASITPFAVESLQWAVGTGLFQGADGKLNPKAGAMRCEVATLFQRLNQMLPSA